MVGCWDFFGLLVCFEVGIGLIWVWVCGWLGGVWVVWVVIWADFRGWWYRFVWWCRFGFGLLFVVVDFIVWVGFGCLFRGGFCVLLFILFECLIVVYLGFNFVDLFWGVCRVFILLVCVWLVLLVDLGVGFGWLFAWLFLILDWFVFWVWCLLLVLVLVGFWFCWIVEFSG